MRIIIIRSLMICAAMLSVGFIGAQDKKTLAVMDFDGFGMSVYEAQTLTERMRSVAVEIGTYIVVERGAMEEILEEQGFQQSGCASDECIVEVGKLMGVQFMLGGTIGKVGETFTVAMRIIDIETGQVIKTANYDMTGAIDKLLTAGMREAAILILGEGNVVIRTPVIKSTEPTLASVIIETNPQGAQIIFNGVSKGLSPVTLSDLQPATNYDLSVSFENYTTINRSVNFKPGTNPPLRVNLTRSRGFLSITGMPKGANLSISGKSIGKLPLTRYTYPTGEHSVVVKRPGYALGKYPVNLMAGQETSLQVNLQAKSKGLALMLSAVVPGSGQLYEGSVFKGVLFLAAAIGAGYMTYNEYSSFQGFEEEYLSGLDLYNNEGDPGQFAARKSAVNSSFEKMQTAEKNINTFLLALGGVWTLNILEVVF